jgi:predicted transcriptional regulator
VVSYNQKELEMSNTLPPDIDALIKARMSVGDYDTEAELLRDALSALDAQNADVAAIQAGIDDMEAGRMRPLDDVASDIRQKHGWVSDR